MCKSFRGSFLFLLLGSGLLRQAVEARVRTRVSSSATGNQDVGLPPSPMTDGSFGSWDGVPEVVVPCLGAYEGFSLLRRASLESMPSQSARSLVQMDL